MPGVWQVKPRAWWYSLPYYLRVYLTYLRLREYWRYVVVPHFITPDPDDEQELELIGWGIRAELLERRRMRLMPQEYDGEDCA